MSIPILVALSLVALLLVIPLGYYGLPVALRAMGVHRHHEIPKFALSGKRALLIATSHDKLGDSGWRTGVFGSELTVPYYAFVEAGMEVDIASPQGGEVPVDPLSGWPLATPEDRRFHSDEVAMKKLRNSLKVSEIDGADYDIIFLAGGWGAAYDLGQSAEVGHLITRGNAKQAVVGGVCHGPLGLLQAKDADGKPLVQGRKLTAVSDRQVRQLRITETPMHPETELRNLGANYEKNTAIADFLATHVVVDGNLVTGQNQNSGAETAHRMMELING